MCLSTKSWQQACLQIVSEALHAKMPAAIEYDASAVWPLSLCKFYYTLGPFKRTIYIGSMWPLKGSFQALQGYVGPFNQLLIGPGGYWAVHGTSKGVQASCRFCISVLFNRVFYIRVRAMFCNRLLAGATWTCAVFIMFTCSANSCWTMWDNNAHCSPKAGKQS